MILPGCMQSQVKTKGGSHTIIEGADAALEVARSGSMAETWSQEMSCNFGRVEIRPLSPLLSQFLYQVPVDIVTGSSKDFLQYREPY